MSPLTAHKPRPIIIGPQKLGWLKSRKSFGQLGAEHTGNGGGNGGPQYVVGVVYPCGVTRTTQIVMVVDKVWKSKIS
jgi:hypothetical protein